MMPPRCRWARPFPRTGRVLHASGFESTKADHPATTTAVTPCSAFLTPSFQLLPAVNDNFSGSGMLERKQEAVCIFRIPSRPGHGTSASRCGNPAPCSATKTATPPDFGFVSKKTWPLSAKLRQVPATEGAIHTCLLCAFLCVSAPLRPKTAPNPPACPWPDAQNCTSPPSPWE